MGPNVSGKSDPILPSSVVIASGNPAPVSLPLTTALCLSATAARGIKDLLPTIDKAKLEKRVRLAQGFSSSFSHYFPHEEVTAYSDFYEQTVKFMSGDMAEPFDIMREPGTCATGTETTPLAKGSSCQKIGRERRSLTFKSLRTAVGTRCTEDRETSLTWQTSWMAPFPP